jgi:predicted PurR-regulated permease PerM
MEERRFMRIFLIAPSLLVLYFVFRIFQPFFMPIFMAVILAGLCFPAYRWVNGRLKGHANLAALVTCLGITFLIIVPFVALAIMLATQGAQAYQELVAALNDGRVQQMMTLRDQPYVGWVLDTIDEYVDLDKFDLMGSLASMLQSVSLGALRHSTAVVSGIAHTLASFLIMLVTMFFLFRDGTALADQVSDWTPLSDKYEGQIVKKFQEVSSATVIGSLVTAIAQGTAGGITFWIVGIPNLLFWGTLIALFSLVPLVGTAVIWLPWALFLLAKGSTVNAIILVVLSVVFVGGIDNVLRPVLIEGKTRMHTLMVFFSIMGGISYFGIVGMIVGPILVALGLTFLELYKIEFQEELGKPKAGSSR